MNNQPASSAIDAGGVRAMKWKVEHDTNRNKNGRCRTPGLFSFLIVDRGESVVFVVSNAGLLRTNVDYLIYI